ncbi:MAG TPA: hypothetical protein VGG95_05080 [Edaphobacter sp.]
MKRILLSSTLALAFTATAAFCQQSTPQQPTGDAPVAQQPADQHSRHHHHAFDAHKAALHMGKRLNLTDDQTAKLEPILATQQQKITSLRSDTSLTPDQRREQFRAIHKDTQTQFATVLTPDQMQQLQSMRRSHGRRQPQQQPGQQPDSATPPSAS